MTRKPLGAAAALSLLGAAVLTIVFWHQILAAVAGGFALRLAWLRIRKLTGHTPARRRGKSVAEVAAAGIGGYLVGRRGGETHPCAQCGAPIGHPSRASYCSPACRKYAALERAATEERSARLAAFGDVPEGFGA